jgi:hypothetical protein
LDPIQKLALILGLVTAAASQPSYFPHKTFPVSTDGGDYYAFVNGGSRCLVTGEGGGCGDDSDESCTQACRTLLADKVVQTCSWDAKTFSCVVTTNPPASEKETLTDFLSSAAGIPYCNDPSIHSSGCTIAQGYIPVSSLILAAHTTPKSSSAAASVGSDYILNTWIIKSYFGTGKNAGESHNNQAQVLITKDITRDKTGKVLKIETPLSGCLLSFTKGNDEWNVVPSSINTPAGLTKCGVADRTVADSPFEHGALLRNADTTTKVGFNVGKCGVGEEELSCNGACTTIQKHATSSAVSAASTAQSSSDLVLLLGLGITSVAITVQKPNGHSVAHGRCAGYPNQLALGDDVCKAFNAGCAGTCPAFQTVLNPTKGAGGLWAKGCATLSDAKINELYKANMQVQSTVYPQYYPY